MTYQASKWLSIEILINSEEMTGLFSALPPFFLFKLGGVYPKGESQISQKDFLKAYKQYVSLLKKREIPEEKSYRSSLTCALSVDREHLSFHDVPDDKEIVKIVKPVIQMKPHTMDFSADDHKFRSQVLGSDVMTWGVQLSYPQLFEDPVTREAHKVTGDAFPNTELFRATQKWCRHHTQPTPFIHEGKKIYSSIRIGKKSFDLARNHPQLSSKELTIGESRAVH